MDKEVESIFIPRLDTFFEFTDPYTYVYTKLHWKIIIHIHYIHPVGRLCYRRLVNIMNLWKPYQSFNQAFYFLYFPQLCCVRKIYLVKSLNEALLHWLCTRPFWYMVRDEVFWEGPWYIPKSDEVPSLWKYIVQYQSWIIEGIHDPILTSFFLNIT